MERRPRAIWKFPLAVEDNQVLMMPDDAEILCVQVQHGQPCLWAIVTPGAKLRPRAFAIFGTGHPFPPDGMASLRYLGTVQAHGGSLVWHVFEAATE